MRKISYLLFAAVAMVTFNACNEPFKKGENGMEYKVIHDGKGETLKPGQFIAFNVTSLISRPNGKDSVLNSSVTDGAPQIIKFDSINIPPQFYKIFLTLKNGDSLCTKTLTDTAFKQQPTAMPPFMKPGQTLYTTLRVVNIYKTEAEAEKAKTEGMANMEKASKAKAAAQLITDEKVLTDYFAKNNIKATKTPLGAYVEILQAGTGAVLDTNSFAKINYKGTNLEGKMFDTNMDTSKGHMEPLSVNLTKDVSLGNGVIPGMSDALVGLNKGTKAKLYIPSSLGYGARGAGADIAPNTNLIFEVEVLDIQSKVQIVAQNMAAQAKMMAAQKRYKDSLRKVNPEAAKQMDQQMQQMQQPQQGQ